MPTNFCRLPPLNSLVVALLVWALAALLAARLESSAMSAEVPGQAMTVTDRSAPVSALRIRHWFRKYDQIRRDAEMTLKEKLHLLALMAYGPERRNAIIASRIMAKYATAAARLNELEPIPETSKLQEGYVQFYTAGRRLLADYLAKQHVVPSSKQLFRRTKKELEELDKVNKALDARLRQRFNIAKHRHR